MKSMIVVLSLALMGTGLVSFDAEAKRLGGGSSAGMQRSVPPRAPPTATPTPPTQAAPAAPATAGAAPAAAPKRSWMGPLAGLAAGLGIAALMSHLGLGAAFGNILMLALIGVVGFVVIRMLMNRFARGNAAPGTLATPNGMQFSGAGAGPSAGASMPAAAPFAAAATPPAAVSSLPADFDAAAFERIAKLIFIRMQAANDAADLNDLRAFTTPEMYAAIKLDLQERGSAAQTTDVVRIDAEVLDVVSEPERRLVSVRFHGLVREDKDAAATPFDEVWHLVRPADGSHEWAIAGIQQAAAA